MKVISDHAMEWAGARICTSDNMSAALKDDALSVHEMAGSIGFRAPAPR